MNRIGLLLNDGVGDDQVLETDIMRFMAIIGIVFWIIFSMIESMPLEKETRTSASIVPASMTSDADATQPSQPTEPFIPSQPVPQDMSPKPDQVKKIKPVVNKTAEKKQEKATASKSEKAENKKKETAVPSLARKGLGLEFESLDAILTLMKNQQIEIFGRTKATGFDLIFKAYLSANTIRFQNADSLPGKLWEIKDGEAHAHFIHLISSSFPSIKIFPEKQILVSFTDSGLDQLVESEFSHLQQENQNGILSVTSAGLLKFESFSQSDEIDEDQNQGETE